MGKKNKNTFVLSKPLKHVAFILDGNGRWAKKRMLPRSMGHKAGVKNIRNIIYPCFFDYNVYATSLYIFSTENWNRPEKEVSYLMELVKRFFEDYIDEFMEKDIKILVSGALEDERIPSDTKRVIEEAIERTKDNKSHVINLLFNYGGRREIVDAVKKILLKDRARNIDLCDLDEEIFKQYLYADSLPDVDLLIRTSGEQRISNCVLYELAYAEFIFNDKYWPEYTPEDLLHDLKIYDGRHRRFGGLKNE